MSVIALREISRKIHTEWVDAIERFLIEIGATPENVGEFTLWHNPVNPLSGDIMRNSDQAMMGWFATSIRQDEDGNVSLVVETHRGEGEVVKR
jgi:hypothetical protein